MTESEIIELIRTNSDPVKTAEEAMLAIADFSDSEMRDGDAARNIAEVWVQKFVV